MQAEKALGELRPQGEGAKVVLTSPRLLVGRHESCGLILNSPNVSAKHCQLALMHGYWTVDDLDSRNGVKINGERITTGVIKPDDLLTIADVTYSIHYSPSDLGAIGPPPPPTRHPDAQPAGGELPQTLRLRKPRMEE